MNRSGERIRVLLGAAAVCALLVVPVALAGSASTAGGPKATASAGVKKKLNSLQRQINALKAQAGTPGPQGPQGIQGAQGIPGPGAISFDRQFPNDNAFHVVTTVNGLALRVTCSNVPSVELQVSNVSHGWGTKAHDGGMLSSANVTGTDIGATGQNSADLDVVAKPGATGDQTKWTRFDLNVVRGLGCNVHGLVIPSSSVG